VIRASWTTPTGRSIVLLGLSRANVDRLTMGQPIRVDLDELLPDGPSPSEVLISFGETEAAIVAELQAAGVRVPGVPS
jgi:hypothetical protein